MAKELVAPKNPLILRAIQHYAAIKRAHAALYRAIIEVKQQAQMGSFRMEELADLAYVAKRTAELADDIRKEEMELSNVSQQQACTLWVQRGTADPASVQASIYGDIATGTPEIKTVTTLPGKATPEYYQMMAALDIPKDLIDNSAISIHWPNFCAYLQKRTASGLSLPKGIDAAHTSVQYALTLRQAARGELESLLP